MGEENRNSDEAKSYKGAAEIAGAFMDARDEAQRDEPDRVAGITLVHISDEAPHPYTDKPGGYAGRLERLYQRALAATETSQGYFRSDESDPRLVDMMVWEQQTPRIPSFHFLATRHLIDTLSAAAAQKQTELTQDEILRLALEDNEGAVAADFDPRAMNAVNATYYSSDEAFAPESGPAGMYGKNRPLNYALGRLMATGIGQGDSIRIKELSSGSRTDHWRDALQGVRAGGAEQVELTLTDFVQPPANPVAGVTSTEVYSLFDDLPPLPPEERYSAIVATYGFDSVWQPEDARLQRIGEQWYEERYRVKVADWSPRREELLGALREGRPLEGAVPSDFAGMYVERASEPIDISAHPYRRYIGLHDSKSFGFPGGLIKRVVNAFENQLTDEGVFISCDTGDFGHMPERTLLSARGISGVAARYHSDDFRIAKEILEQEHGFEVSLMTLDEVAGQYLPENWQDQATPDEIDEITNNASFNGLIVVRRRSHSSAK
jgi:hypothetical protein